jgi:hypothetical protein
MEKYSDILRRLADSLDDNFSKNLEVVMKEISDLLKYMLVDFINMQRKNE